MFPTYRRIGEQLWPSIFTPFRRLSVGSELSIAGTVTDGVNPVNGATITLGSKSTTSGADGTYLLTGLAAGSSGTLTCTMTNYTSIDITIASMTGNLTGQDFILYGLKIHDAFTDANGTNLNAHVIGPVNVPGNSWVNVYTAAGNLTIQSNRATAPAFGSGFYGLETGVTDLIVTATIRLASATAVNKLHVRMDSLVDAIATERNAWQIRFGNGKLEIYDGNATLRATTNLTTNAGQDYALRIECIGTTITTYVDGANKITYSPMATHLASTKVCLVLNSAAQVSNCEDYKVFF